LLLVDDDADALTASADLLRLLGYTVTAVDSPSKVLQLLHGREHFDVLLTDIIMPAMNGVELGQRALDLRQDLRVIYLTGYSEEAFAKGLFLHGEVVLKPWSVQDLQAAINRSTSH
jgi:two-component system cell cycle response regulator CpdR